MKKEEGNTGISSNIIKPFKEWYALSRQAMRKNEGLLYYMHLYIIYVGFAKNNKSRLKHFNLIVSSNGLETIFLSNENSLH